KPQRIILNFLEYGGVQAMRVSFADGKRIDDQQMDALLQELAGLPHECSEGMGRILVSGRHDLNHCHDAITADVANDNGFLLAQVKFGWSFLKELGRRPSERG